MPVPNLMPVPAFRQCAKLAKLTTGVTEQTFQDLPSGHIKHFRTLLFGQNSHYTQTPISSESTYYDSFWFCVSQNCIFVDVFYSRWIGILEAALNHMLPHFHCTFPWPYPFQIQMNWLIVNSFSMLNADLSEWRLAATVLAFFLNWLLMNSRPTRSQWPLQLFN